MNACGPGEVKPMHLDISSLIALLLCLVSNIPGVSTTTIFLSNLKTVHSEQPEVTDDPAGEEVNTCDPRMVFPVALFPDPVFPSKTILNSGTSTTWSFSIERRLSKNYRKGINVT